MRQFNEFQKRGNIFNAGSKGKDSFGKPFADGKIEKQVSDIVSELRQIAMWGPKSKNGEAAYKALGKMAREMEGMPPESQMALARALKVAYASFPEEMKLLAEMDMRVSSGEWNPPPETKMVVNSQYWEAMEFFKAYMKATETGSIEERRGFIGFAFGEKGNRDFEYPAAYYLALERGTGKLVMEILADRGISEMTARVCVVSLAKDLDFTDMRKALEGAIKTEHPLLREIVNQFYEQFPIVKGITAHVPLETKSPESERINLEYATGKGTVAFRIRDMDNRTPVLLLKALKECEQWDLRFNSSSN